MSLSHPNKHTFISRMPHCSGTMIHLIDYRGHAIKHGIKTMLLLLLHIPVQYRYDSSKTCDDQFTVYHYLITNPAPRPFIHSFM
jgi:hypothetical protein